MLCSNTNREHWENLNELVSLPNQVEELRLHDLLEKQNVHQLMKKTFEPVSKLSNDVSDAVTKTLKTTSEDKIKAIANLYFQTY